MIFPGALGDLLLAAPALRMVRRRHPGAHVTAVVAEPLRSLALLAGIADATASLDGGDTAWLFGGTRPPAWLARRPFVYSALGVHDATVAERLARSAGGLHRFAVVRTAGEMHASREYAEALRVKLERAGRAAVVAPPSERAAELLASVAAPVLVVHRGAGARSKRWAAAGFAALGRWWRSSGGSVITLVGPAEIDDPVAADGPCAWAWPLPDVAALLAGAALYVGNDSGVSHLAGGVGARGVALFGPTEPRRWRPLGTVGVLRARGGDGDGFGLDALPVRRVVAACRRHLTLTRGDPDTSVATSPAARVP